MSMTEPVLTDDTGRRATVLLWLGRLVVTVSVIVGAAMAFTLTTHIALPGLGGLVSPTLNGSQPKVAIPATPDPDTDATDPATDVSELTATPRAKSGRSSSHRTTSPAVSIHRAVRSSTKKPSTSTPTSATRSAAKPRSSHPASSRTAGRKTGKAAHPTPPGQTRKPVR